MRFTPRLLAAIWVSVLMVLAGFAWLQVREERLLLTTDLERRATLLGDGIREAVEPALGRGSTAGIERVLKKFAGSLQGVAVYDRFAAPFGPAAGPVPAALPEVTEAIAAHTVQKGLRGVNGARTYVYVTPLGDDDRPAGALAVLLDASHLNRAEWALWRLNGVRFIVLALVISLITLVVVRISITHPMAVMAAWTRELRAGRALPPPEVPDAKLFGPLALEVSGLARSLYRARATAQQEAALRLRGETLWTEERLRQFARFTLGGRPLFVVSNREPVSHVWRNGQIEAEAPASGMVTAIEPVMRACGGVWVAHASGDADAAAADARGRLAVPPDDPCYTLRRVWLAPEEVDGYYHGFANEGLWPLCHIVHTRPLFRPEDWARYRAVNEKFAAAVLEETAGTEAPMILIQDFHFALLPALIKRECPAARVAIFWHVPWPNFEVFGICPWQEEILLGMLRADLIGFHTQYYCNNFLETVERGLEARVDWERFAVTRGQHVTYVKPFPISVAPKFLEDPPAVSREALLGRLGVTSPVLGVGVERLDYTKGLPERFRALQRFFERYPEYRERVVFVQLAAPSRSRIPRYQALVAEVRETVEEVNRATQTKNWRPILFLEGQHQHRAIWPFYRHADFCMVTSLHDGMNLVAKEFVSVRDDEDGVLILSRFTGAARELPDAVLVNPYDVDEMAEVIRAAVEMPPGERKARMARMRQTVREHNIYRWAGLLLGELSRLPQGALPARAA
jgi:trehalose 6-phosphate synthase